MYISAASDSSLKLTTAELEGLSEDERIDHLIERVQMAGIFAKDDDPQQIRALLRVLKMNLQMRYQPSTKSGVHAVHFHASTVSKVHPTSLDDTYGWCAHFTQPMECYAVPGTHFSILEEPHVQSLASQLQTQLDRATFRVLNRT